MLANALGYLVHLNILKPILLKRCKHTTNKSSTTLPKGYPRP